MGSRLGIIFVLICLVQFLSTADSCKLDPSHETLLAFMNNMLTYGAEMEQLSSVFIALHKRNILPRFFVSSYFPWSSLLSLSLACCQDHKNFRHDTPF